MPHWFTDLLLKKKRRILFLVLFCFLFFSFRLHLIEGLHYSFHVKHWNNGNIIMSGYSGCTFQNLFASELCTTQFINYHPAGRLLSPSEPHGNLDPDCILVPDVIVIAKYSPAGHFGKQRKWIWMQMQSFCFTCNLILTLASQQNLLNIPWKVITTLAESVG